MNQEKKNALKSIILYAIAILIIVLVNASGKFKSQERVINFDSSLIIFIAILNVIFLVINGIKAYLMEKQTKLSFIIHFIVLIIWIAYCNW